MIAIHGDYDPHPAEGVEKPLATVLKDFRLFCWRSVDMPHGLNSTRGSIFVVSSKKNCCRIYQGRPNTAGCVLKSHRLLAGESPVQVRVRPQDSGQP